MTRLSRFLLAALTIVVLACDPEAGAQDSGRPDRIILWSPQGPVAVERAAPMSAASMGPDSEAERLLRALLDGPTPSEAGTGLRTAIPGGTALESVLEAPDGTIVVRLRVPDRALTDLSHEGFEIIVHQIGKTLTPLDWRHLRIHTRDSTSGDFVALASFLPDIEVPAKPSLLEEPGGSVASSGEEEEPPAPYRAPTSSSQEADASAASTASGQPPAPGQAQPQGALTGKTVYVSAGHGWQWSSGSGQWRTQRPPYPSSGYDGVPIIEDHNNAEGVNQYLLHYLWNAGAQVWPVRERDMNTEEAVLDDGGSGYSGSGWTAAAGGYDGDYRWAETTTGSASASATWAASLPSDGRYAVYVWYRSGSNRAQDARYTVHHAGGETAVSVDQRYHGYTWHYIGTYGFLGGEQARVTLTNHSNYGGQAVIADAVRFGGGVFDSLAGIQTDAPSAPGKPWWEAGSYYFTQKMGMAAADNDVVARPVYARWEHAGTGDDAVFVSWHTNGWTGSAQTLLSGTETYVHNGMGLPRTEGSLALRDAIHSEVVHDIRGAWDPSWDDRGQREANYGELRLLWDANPATRMPGVLIEIGYHDNPDDTDALREPSFNQLVARAIYQGIVKYFDPGGALLPEPPTRLRVENVAGGDVRVSWRASQTDGEGLGGGPATGYRVYTSGNGIGWSNGIPVSGATEMTLTDVAPGELLFVRVTATNGGGESFPTETLAVRGGDAANLLLVNGFDRLNRTMEIRETDPVEGLNARMIQDRMNRYDYVIQHGGAIPYAFDSATNGAVRSGTVDLTDYSIVDWILGEESGGDEAFADAEQSLVKTYLDGGGALFVSGSEVAWDLDLMGDTGDRQFYRDYLRARYDSDDAGTYEVKGVNGTFVGLSFRFDEPGMYDADYPDRLTPNGSTGVLAYGSDGGQGTAGVQYASGCERVVNFGFPFETIRTAQTRNDVMAAVLEFLGLNRRLPDTLIVSPSDGSGHAETPAFDGTADAQCGTLDRVDVLIEQSSSGRYWNGASWGTTATWLVASGTEAWSYPLPTSLADGDYHLWARAWAEGVPDESPAAVMFTHDTVAPATPSLIAPTDGAEISALPQLVLDWTDVSDSGSPVSYRVQLDGQMFDATSSEYARHVADGFHQWRVQAEDAAENVSGWTEQWSFLVSRLHAWLPLVLRGSGEPSPECSDVIVNGGFEWDGGWALNSLAIYQSDQVHSGAQSARVGIPPGDPDSYSYSSVSQEVTLPTGSSATLRMWVYPISENNDPGDLHYVWLHDESGGSHPLDTTTTDSREWTYREYPGLTDFLGQAVTISIGAKNDGDGDTAALYIDDVQLEVCP